MDPLTPGTLHVAVDMQRLFAEPTPWHTPALGAIIPNVAAIAERHRERTLFARFTTPPNAAAAPGRWRRYYERWASVTTDHLDPALLDLVPALAALAAPDAIFDKATFSIFGAPLFEARLAREAIDTLVISGVETDVCVLASVLDAVDRGFRVVLPIDAVASGSAEAHRVVIEHVLPRFSEQVDLAETAAVLAAWR